MRVRLAAPPLFPGPAVLAVATLLGVVACALLPENGRDPVPLPSGARMESSAEELHLRRLNQHRAEENLSPLERLDCLDQVARDWTARMAADDWFEHNPELVDEVSRACSPRVWRRVGENIAVGPDADRMFDGWLDSPGHRANIENEAFRHVGIAAVRAGDGRLWSTHVFARFL